MECDALLRNKLNWTTHANIMQKRSQSVYWSIQNGDGNWCKFVQLFPLGEWLGFNWYCLQWGAIENMFMHLDMWTEFGIIYVDKKNIMKNPQEEET